jgi:broad specificity phosphatase PhoE
MDDSESVQTEGKVFLIRHAQSSYNQACQDLENIGKKSEIRSLKWQPRYIDVELSDFGERQAEQAQAAAHRLRVKTVFVSPLRRALRTAQILFETHPDQPRIVVHPQLAEKLKNAPDVSVYRGIPFNQFRKFDWSLFNSNYFLFDIVKNSTTERLSKVCIDEIPGKLLEEMERLQPEKIEKADDMFKRTQESKEIWKKQAENGNVALVAHSNFFKFYSMKWVNGEKMYRWMQNCEILDSELL